MKTIETTHIVKTGYFSLFQRSLSFSSEDDQGHEPDIVTTEKKKSRWNGIGRDRDRNTKRENGMGMDAKENGQRNAANEQVSGGVIGMMHSKDN